MPTKDLRESSGEYTSEGEREIKTRTVEINGTHCTIQGYSEEELDRGEAEARAFAEKCGNDMNKVVKYQEILIGVNALAKDLAGVI